MSTYRFDRLLAPRSIALVGGSPRAGSLGRIVLRNLREGGFGGRIFLVNPRHAEIDGLAASPELRALPAVPDAVVVTAPPAEVPQIVADAARIGVAGAIVITAGLGHGEGSLSAQVLAAARQHGCRIIGPNGLGLLLPPLGLNASFAAHAALPGDLALISQSGAVAAGMVEWARARGIGFSAVVSIGDAVDVDFADLLDHFALDNQTRAILLYVESISAARKFMSAARAAARIKPVVVIKAGRHAQGARAAATHTGALAGVDAVYDAAFRRAGLLRVFDLDELFAAAESLGRQRPFPGRRLAILTNGGGIGVLAVDRLIDLGGTLATLSEGTMASLDARLPPGWSKANPVDIVGDADAERYRFALNAILDDPNSDAALVMNVPTALASAIDSANAVAATVRERRAAQSTKPVFAAWVGEDADARAAFETNTIPYYGNEADAVGGVMHLVHYREAQDALMETPPSLPEAFTPDVAAARAVVTAALRDGQRWLDPLAIAKLCEAYQIPFAPVALAADPDAAAAAAAPLLQEGSGVVVKILSPDIVHKSEVGGVRLNLTSANAVRQAAAEILARAKELRPEARISGVTIHRMIARPKARELIAGIADDATFGPVLVFGSGGTAVEVVDDKALALPPLDLRLAHELIARTRVARILRAYRDVPASDIDAVALTLVKVAQLAADLPEIRELDFNPLLADQSGVIAIDARVAIAPLDAASRSQSWHPRLAIRPYPKQWERQDKLADGSHLLVRPVRPDDEALFRSFFARVSAEDLRLRFFAAIKEFSHTFVARLTQLDYARAIAFVALDQRSGEMLGAVRLHVDSNHEEGEYAVLVRSDYKGRGLGWLLMQRMIEYARAEGLRRIDGQVLAGNTTMLSMCEQLGFQVTTDPQDRDIRRVKLSITTAQESL